MATHYLDPLPDRYTLWRSIGRDRLTPAAQLKLEWIIFYHTLGKRNAAATAAHFEVSRKTFHKWLKRFNDTNLTSLEDQSRAPHRVRQWHLSVTEQERIIGLRKQFPQLGKVKLKVLYHTWYHREISTWKIERVIRAYRLFPDRKRHARLVIRHRKDQAKPRIHRLDVTGVKPGSLWHTDTIHLTWNHTRRVIFTAVEHTTRLAFAHLYQSHTSQHATDFLTRLQYVSDHQLKIIHHDNGSEFAGDFETACLRVGIHQLYSRVRHPKDNAAVERFNRTLQEEWLAYTDVDVDDLAAGNHSLTDWLVHYDQERPHQTLAYQTPLQYAQDHYFKVLPMWSASTVSILSYFIMI